MKKTKLLDVESYNSAEAAAADRFPIRVNQAFFPEMFASVGYPARVERLDQLWRYIDVMHETRTTYNMDRLLHGLTGPRIRTVQRGYEDCRQPRDGNYGRRAHATSALLRALHVLRLIKIVTGDERPAVLEVGPGCGYLAMFLSWRVTRTSVPMLRRRSISTKAICCPTLQKTSKNWSTEDDDIFHSKHQSRVQRFTFHGGNGSR